MKINFIKNAGGLLVPANDAEADRMTRFKTGEMVEIDIKLTRNPAFHRKVFAFFNFCFEHWVGNDMQTESKQFNMFRKDLTALAGYYDSYPKIGGGVLVEAKSLAYGNMEQDEFEQCYIALTNAAMKHIFTGADDSVYNQLISFF